MPSVGKSEPPEGWRLNLLKALQPDNVAQSSNTRGRSGLLDPAAARGSRVPRERAHISCHSNDSHLC